MLGASLGPRTVPDNDVGAVPAGLPLCPPIGPAVRWSCKLSDVGEPWAKTVGCSLGVVETPWVTYIPWAAFDRKRMSHSGFGGCILVTSGGMKGVRRVRVDGGYTPWAAFDRKRTKASPSALTLNWEWPKFSRIAAQASCPYEGGLSVASRSCARVAGTCKG